MIGIRGGSDSSGVDRMLNKHTQSMERSYDRLASGKRINSAKDDAAGLAIATSLFTDSNTRGVAIRNMNDSISMADIADSAIGTASDITTRMSELSLQAANGTLNDEQRQSLNNEYVSLRSELDRISETTEFNGQKLLDGNNTTDLQVGIDGSSASRVSVKMPGVSAASLDMPADILSAANARQAIDVSSKAVESLASSRAEIGASVNRIGVALDNAFQSQENERAAASRISDLDYASESSNLVANRISQEAATAMKAQANQSAQIAMRLLT